MAHAFDSGQIFFHLVCIDKAILLEPCRSKPVSEFLYDVLSPFHPTDLHRLYGSTKSLTGDYSSLSDLRGSSSNLLSSKDERDPAASYGSFSTYLAMRTKSPARPPLSRASSLQGTTSTSSSARRSEDERTRSIEDEEPKYTKSTTDTKTSKPPTLSSVSESKPTKSSLTPIAENKNAKSTTSSTEGKPPKPPSRLRPSIKLGEIKETHVEERPKNILMLRVSSFFPQCSNSCTCPPPPVTSSVYIVSYRSYFFSQFGSKITLLSFIFQLSLQLSYLVSMVEAKACTEQLHEVTILINNKYYNPRMIKKIVICILSTLKKIHFFYQKKIFTS